MTNQGGGVRDNHVVAFVEGREIAWRPAPAASSRPAHQWGWVLEALEDGRTLVTHVYDFSDHPPRRARSREGAADDGEAHGLDRPPRGLAEGA